MMRPTIILAAALAAGPALAQQQWCATPGAPVAGLPGELSIGLTQAVDGTCPDGRALLESSALCLHPDDGTPEMLWRDGAPACWTAGERLAIARHWCTQTVYARYLTERDLIATVPQIADCSMDIPDAETCGAMRSGFIGLNTEYTALRADIADADLAAAQACAFTFGGGQ